MPHLHKMRFASVMLLLTCLACSKEDPCLDPLVSLELLGVDNIPACDRPGAIHIRVSMLGNHADPYTIFLNDQEVVNLTDPSDYSIRDHIVEGNNEVKIITSSGCEKRLDVEVKMDPGLSLAVSYKSVQHCPPGLWEVT